MIRFFESLALSGHYQFGGDKSARVGKMDRYRRGPIGPVEAAPSNRPYLLTIFPKRQPL
jgi:hypothetical protein